MKNEEYGNKSSLENCLVQNMSLSFFLFLSLVTKCILLFSYKSNNNTTHIHVFYDNESITLNKIVNYD